VASWKASWETTAAFRFATNSSKYACAKQTTVATSAQFAPARYSHARSIGSGTDGIVTNASSERTMTSQFAGFRHATWLLRCRVMRAIAASRWEPGTPAWRTAGS
jgi:hypothetical protein